MRIGIWNSFGIDFDPITGKLWDTENGVIFGDEINLVEPGFNSGWNKIDGIWLRGYPIEDTEDRVATNQTKGLLVDFNGKGKYSSPEFTWFNDVGPTAIRFFNSDKLGNRYQDDIFVGDIMNGNIYHFELNKERGGRIAIPLNSSYHGSKFALEGLSESIQYELEPFGIKVILIEPGAVGSNFWKNIKIAKSSSDSDSPYTQFGNKILKAYKEMEQNTISPSVVAKTILDAITSNNPQLRYVVGEDAAKTLEARKNMPDNEFGKKEK
jgi:hypothetical protein